MEGEPQPKKGDVVTFSFTRYSPTGVPRAPAIFRIRPEYEWRNITPDRKAPLQRLVRSTLPARIMKPHGYWSIDASINIRRLLDSFASKNNFDPLIPENWYHVKIKDIVNDKHLGVSVLPKYDSLYKAIADVYPDIGIDVTKFPNVKAKYYTSAKMQRSYLDLFAAQSGFDPLVAENWYSVTMPAINRNKNVKGIRRKYQSLRTALITLYPDVSFDISEFSKMPQKHWEIGTRRKFFDALAKRRGFDPLIPENWYTVDKKTIQSEKKGNTILHKCSIPKILQAAYPDIGLDRSKFRKYNYWTLASNRKAFFDRFAATRAFDPLTPDNWYHYQQADFLSEQGGSALLGLYYNNSYIAGLLDVYPDIGLHQLGFPVKPQKYWKHIPNMRNFCDEYAARKGFDPLIPINWYLVDRAELLKEKGAGRIAAKFGSMESGLLQLYPEVPLSRKGFIRSSHSRKLEHLGNLVMQRE